MRAFFLVICLFTSTWCSASPADAPLKFKHRSTSRENAPVIILLHGYGSNESDLFSIQVMPDAHVFSLRGPYPLQNGGFSWFGLQFLGDRQFSFDYSQAKESREKILSFISWACKEYKADSSRVVVVGFSQGAMMGYELALHTKGKIAGVAALSGGIVPGSKNGISSHVKNLPIFIAHGNSDDVVEYKYSTDARDFMNKQGALVTFRSYNHGHNISEAEMNDLTAWIRSSVPKK